eukprot:scaffold7406_cov36-Phaeocystis_antarctica.AAC.2
MARPQCRMSRSGTLRLSRNPIMMSSASPLRQRSDASAACVSSASFERRMPVSSAARERA